MGGELDYLPLNNLQEVVPALLSLVPKQSLVYNLDHNCYSVHKWPLSDSDAQISGLDGIVLSAQDAGVVYTKFRENRRIFIIKTVSGNVLICKNSRLFSLLKSKLDSVIRNGFCLTADEEVKIDSKLLIANKYEHTRCSSGRRTKSVLLPSPEHSAADKEENAVFAYLVDTATYTNPDYHSNERSRVRESKPVQASDHETDTLDMCSIATNASSSSQHRSIFGTGQLSRTRSTLSIGQGGYASSLYQSEGCQHSQYTPSSVDATSYNSKPPRHPDYVLLCQRKTSFQTSIWAVHSKPQIDILAECGFFFTGYADLVRCYQCGIGLKDWMQDDDVLVEHIKYSSDCGHLQNTTGRREIEHLENARTGQAHTNNNSQTLAGSQPPYKIHSPRYQTMEARIASYAIFPSHNLTHNRTHAVAGLYYTGSGDLCRCFACDGGLKDWKSGDDPIKEHATYFPNCPYINQLKGQEYVRSLQRTSANNSFKGSTTAGNGAKVQESNASTSHSMDKLSIDNTRSSLTTTQVVQSLGYSELDVVMAMAELERKGNTEPTSEDIVNTILDIQDRTHARLNNEAGANGSDIGIKAIAEENERLSQFVECMLCVSGEPDILFLPCAHRRICHDCAVGIVHCPICGSVIREKVKTYRA